MSLGSNRSYVVNAVVLAILGFAMALFLGSACFSGEASGVWVLVLSIFFGLIGCAAIIVNVFRVNRNKKRG